MMRSGHFARAGALLGFFVSVLAACGLDVEGTEFSGAASGPGGAAGSASGGASGGITGGAGGGAGGAGGAIMTCSPGAVEVCYTGPAGTKGVGSCKGGERTCNADGDGFGPCVGEKTPVPEDCGTLGDDDCDGSTACSCSPAWENVFGSPGNDDIGDIATDGAGNVFIASRFNGKVMLSKNAVHTAQGKIDVLVAKIAPDGKVVWSKSFGGSENDRPIAIAVTGTGEVVVAGLFEGVVNFGASNVNAGMGAAFVMRLHPDGSFLNMVMVDGLTSEFPLDVAVDAAGNAYVVGLYEGTLTAGGKALTAVSGTEGFVVKVSPAAAVSWMVGVTGTGEQRVSGVTVDSPGNVYITGAFDNAISMGATVHIAQGASDAYLAQLAPDTGMVKWSKAFGGPLVQAGVRVGVAATDVVVGGLFDGSITVGATTLTENGNGDDLFVARLPASGLGLPVWVKKFGSKEDDRLQGMAIELDSNVLLSGSFQGSIGFGGPGLTTKGGQDIFFARLSPLGGHICSRSFGGTGAQVGKAVAAGAAGAAFLSGEFGGNINFGFGAHNTPNGGDLDAFLLKLNP